MHMFYLFLISGEMLFHFSPFSLPWPFDVAYTACTVRLQDPAIQSFLRPLPYRTVDFCQRLL